MRYDKYIDRAAALIEKKGLMPDICQIDSVSGTTRDTRGVLTPTIVHRMYNSSANIPCRIDNSRSFRPVNGFVQEMNANEYILHLPRGVTVLPNDSITISGRKFEARKRVVLPEFRFTTEALIVEVEAQGT